MKKPTPTWVMLWIAFAWAYCVPFGIMMVVAAQLKLHTRTSGTLTFIRPDVSGTISLPTHSYPCPRSVWYADLEWVKQEIQLSRCYLPI